MPSAISIGCQGGGPETKAVCFAKTRLSQALERHVTRTYCPLIDEIGIVLRVDGSLDQFGDEGLANLRLSKARRQITIDVQIPEPVWKPLSPSALRKYLSHQIIAAIEACIVRLQSEGVVESSELLDGVLMAVEEYLESPP